MKTIPFSWFGGKAAMVKQILPLLDTPHKLYVESFGGSGAVLLNKKPAPVDVYNDLYGDVVHFFRTLRGHPEELVQAIELTPYSREEYEESLGRDGTEGVERARRFFVTARQVQMALASQATPGRWCSAASQSRRGMALVISRWLSATSGLMEVAERLKTTLIEHDDGLAVIKKYDGPNTLHYIDPPYPMGTRSGGRGYALEFTDERHEELLSLVVGLKGKVAISSYDNELYRERLGDWNCFCLKSGSHCARYHKGRELSREECVWTNYSPLSESN